jgi:hypothetical protein
LRDTPTQRVFAKPSNHQAFPFKRRFRWAQPSFMLWLMERLATFLPLEPMVQRDLRLLPV